MEVRILGAHNSETATARLTSLLVDGTLAVDAGGLTSSLSFREQGKVKNILLTHCHYDHIRDVAMMALNISYYQQTFCIHAEADTLDAIASHILNGIIYPDFTEIKTPDKPPVKLCPLKTHKVKKIGGYSVLAVPVFHTKPTVGYQVSSGNGKSFFFSGDTGPGLSSCWEHISPQLLILEATLPNQHEKHAVPSGHLTPRLLGEELEGFKEAKGYLPPVVVVHMSPVMEDEIREETAKVAKKLGADIALAYEGMVINL